MLLNPAQANESRKKAEELRFHQGEKPTDKALVLSSTLCQ